MYSMVRIKEEMETLKYLETSENGSTTHQK
jgi:hypothetical protein